MHYNTVFVGFLHKWCIQMTHHIMVDHVIALLSAFTKVLVQEGSIVPLDANG